MAVPSSSMFRFVRGGNLCGSLLLICRIMCCFGVDIMSKKGAASKVMTPLLPYVWESLTSRIPNDRPSFLFPYVFEPPAQFMIIRPTSSSQSHSPLPLFHIFRCPTHSTRIPTNSTSQPLPRCSHSLLFMTTMLPQDREDGSQHIVAEILR